MKLKELKKEINSLKDINQTIIDFKSSWLKQIKQNTNQHFPFLLNLNGEIKKQVNTSLSSYQKIIHEFKTIKFTQEKISSLAKYLIDLKLAHFNQDKKRTKLLINKFIRDDFLNLKRVVNEISEFDFNLKNMKQIYDQTNKIIVQKLPLEESVVFMDSTHRDYLNTLTITAKKQKKLLKILGKEFVSLVREIKK